MNRGLNISKGTVVLSRGGDQEGRATGTFRCCTMDGCAGLRVGVRWEKDQRMTWPCSKGMEEKEDGTWAIK